MKSIIEMSVYIFLMTLMCFVSLQFIKMNQSVSRVNEISSYIESYIEAKGVCETDEDGNILYYKYVEENDKKTGIIPATTADKENTNITVFPKLKEGLAEDIKASMEEYAKNCGVSINIGMEYIGSTNNYSYMDYTITYNLYHALFGFHQQHTRTGLARFSVIGN